MIRFSPLLLLFVPAFLPASDDPTRLFPDDKKPADRRLTTVRTLNDKDFFLKAPATLDAWKARRQAVREQVLVSTGLWPLPPRTKFKPTIHGRVERDGYSVEKVFFASLPGHYVTGSLYRPRTKAGDLPKGKLPAVLYPHGHWTNARIADAGEDAAKEQVKIKAEQTMEGARFIHQALCAQLARLGCVVFMYDMVGYSDSTAVGHAAFNDAEADLRLQSLMGLHTWNSIRALDFVTSLPEVDAKRVGVTGASGGGTQSFILGAIDDRPAALFPAVMVSTEMQGGCVCENAPYLRIGTGNVEIASVFAPKALAMSGADDWTINIEKKGLPEMKAVWKLYDAGDRVAAKTWPEFKHNYNQPARELMYNWFNKHLDLGHKSPVEEKPFKPVPPAQLRVFDKGHPRPADSLPAGKVRAYLTEVSDKQLEAMRPKDKDTLAAYRKVVGTALRVMLASGMPDAREVEARALKAPELLGVATVKAYSIGRRGQGEQVPALWLGAKDFKGTVVVWVDPAGKASLFKGEKVVPEAKAILDNGGAILAIDAFDTGELKLEKAHSVNPRMAGYTFGYNRPLVSQRAHDVLTAVGFARKQKGVKAVHLYGRGKAGPWALLARGLCGDKVARTAVDLNRFRFDSVRTMTDEMMLPGALKYGGLPGLAGVAAPGEMLLHNTQKSGSGRWLKDVYKAAGAEDKLVMEGDKKEATKVVEWLLR